MVHMKNSNYKKELLEVLTSISSRKEMNTFLEGLLTPSEIEDVSTRLQVVKDIDAGLPQREIAKKYGVGIATVTRGSRVLSSNSGFTKILGWWKARK